jgi:hypothetical protein
MGELWDVNVQRAKIVRFTLTLSMSINSMPFWYLLTRSQRCYMTRTSDLHHSGNFLGVSLGITTPLVHWKKNVIIGLLGTLGILLIPSHIFRLTRKTIESSFEAMSPLSNHINASLSYRILVYGQSHHGERPCQKRRCSHRNMKPRRLLYVLYFATFELEGTVFISRAHSISEGLGMLTCRPPTFSYIS